METHPIRPEMKVLVAAVRAGKGEDAILEYCWAKSVVPILWNRWAHKPLHPMDCSPCYFGTMAMARMTDAFDGGADDAEMVTAFEDGQKWDADNTEFVWREMKKSERPTPDQLIRAMSLDDKMRAAEIFGIRRIAEAIIS